MMASGHGVGQKGGRVFNIKKRCPSELQGAFLMFYT